jgi:hypothetical protein
MKNSLQNLAYIIFLVIFSSSIVNAQNRTSASIEIRINVVEKIIVELIDESAQNYSSLGDHVSNSINDIGTRDIILQFGNRMESSGTDVVTVLSDNNSQLTTIALNSELNIKKVRRNKKLNIQLSKNRQNQPEFYEPSITIIY